jgi:hypothetical protein
MPGGVAWTPRTARRAAWAAFAATVAFWAVSLVSAWLTRDLSAQDDLGSGDVRFLLTLATGMMLLMFPVAGVVIAVRRPGSRVGWLLLAIGLGWGILGGATGYADYGIRLHPGSLLGAEYAAAIASSIWAPPVGLTGTFLLLLFPDGRLAGPRWRWVAYVSILGIVTSTAAGLLDPGPMTNSGYPHTPNPLGIESLGPVIDIAQYAVLVLALAIVASAVSLVVRFRRAGATEREQIKWLATAAAVAAAIYFADLSASVAFAPSVGDEPVWLQLMDNTFIVSIGLIPIAIGVAVLRYRLYDIDVIIRRTLVYAALVGCLALVYLSAVVSIQTAVRTVSGQSGTLAVTVSTLLVAAAFHPLRARIQRAVDHRFYRARYDAERTLEAFSGRLREQVDIETVSGEVLGVVRQTLQPAHATLWIRPPEGGR